MTSDWHGNLPPSIPKCDLLVIAGDVFSDLRQESWCRETLAPYLERVPARSIVAVAGNHDYVAEKPLLMHSLNWTMLYNETAVVQGLKVFGSPNSSTFGSFCMPEEALARIWDTVDEDVDLLITHVPPFGLGDEIYGEHVGSPSLRARLDELTQLRLHAFGHVHEARGSGPLPNGTGWWVNASFVGADEMPGNPLVALRI